MLEGSYIRLAPLRTEDSETLFGWINDRSLTICSAAYHPVDDASHAGWFNRVTHNPSVAIFAIRRASDGSLIGTCQLHSIHSVFRSAELQIRIGNAADQGRGCGTEAVRLLLAHAFRDLNLQRVDLHVFADNTRAIRTYAKCGFQREGVKRRAAWIDNAWRDLVLMSILREEWDATAAG